MLELRMETLSGTADMVLPPILASADRAAEGDAPLIPLIPSSRGTDMRRAAARRLGVTADGLAFPTPNGIHS